MSMREFISEAVVEKISKEAEKEMKDWINSIGKSRKKKVKRRKTTSTQIKRIK